MQPIVVPDRLNMATWFLDARIEEGRGDQVAVHVHPEPGSGLEPHTRTYAELVAGSCRVTNLLRRLGLGI
jgi:benzoate-CoA ligase